MDLTASKQENRLPASRDLSPATVSARMTDLKAEKSSDETPPSLRDRLSALEAEVALYRHALESAREELQGFAYSVSHDLRAPLRAIDGFSKILVEDFAENMEPEARTFLRYILNNTRQLTSQMDDLLGFYRLGKNPPRKDSVEVSSMAREVWEEQKALSQSRDVALELDELPAAWADPDLLRHVLAHILGNAIKFTAENPDPRVKITGRREQGASVYCIADNGVGFDMAYLDKLFQVFQKLHANFPGNGIGLAIVKRIVTAHGGWVRAEGEPEHGAKFWISLPSAAGERS